MKIIFLMGLNYKTIINETLCSDVYSALIFYMVFFT